MLYLPVRAIRYENFVKGLHGLVLQVVYTHASYPVYIHFAFLQFITWCNVIKAGVCSVEYLDILFAMLYCTFMHQGLLVTPSAAFRFLNALNHWPPCLVTKKLVSH